MPESHGKTEGIEGLVQSLMIENENLAKQMVQAGLLMMEKAIKERLTGQRHGRTYRVARSAFKAKREVTTLKGAPVQTFGSPPAEHVAAAEDEAPGVLTGRLRNSISSTDPIIEGNTVSGKYGTNVWYAKIHEYGGFFSILKTKAEIRLPARPYVRPSEDETFPKITALWHRMVGK